MTARARPLLAALLAVELAIGGALAYRQRSEIVPPPVPAPADPITGAEFRRLITGCRAAADWDKLGEAYLVTGYFPEAEACFGHANALAPTAEAAFRHAFALERIGRTDEANERYRAAIERGHPRAADFWYYVGKNHLRREEQAPALAAFSHPSAGPGSRYERALLTADATTADADAARLAAEFPRSYPPVSLRYRLAVARGDRASAAAQANEFANRPAPLPTPFDTEVKWIFTAADGFGRAAVFRDAGREAQAGRIAAAEDKLREALTARWDPEVAGRLADVLFARGRTEEAATVLADVIERGGPTWDALWRLGQAQDALGRGDLVQTTWERAARLATGPAARELWADLADRYERQGAGERAKPLRAKAHLLDAMAAVTTGRYAEAVSAATAATAADPGLAHGWFVAGEAHRLAGRPADAKVAYDRCLSLAPNCGRAERAQRLLNGTNQK